VLAACVEVQVADVAVPVQAANAEGARKKRRKRETAAQRSWTERTRVFGCIASEGPLKGNRLKVTNSD
jgi:hypothetical protein